MVALAQKRVAKYGDHARVFGGDAEAIEAPDAGFDRVIDYGILHHVPNWPQALREISRVLEPGGTFYFEDLLKGFISAWPIRILFDHPQATQFTGREFRAGLEAAGLRVEKWRQWHEWGIMGQGPKKLPASLPRQTACLQPRRITLTFWPQVAYTYPWKLFRLHVVVAQPEP